MKRPLLTALFSLILLVSSAHAQDGAPNSNGIYVGVSYSAPTRILAQFGYNSTLAEPGFSVRGSLQYALGTFGFLALGDALYRFSGDSVAPYLGGGAGSLTVVSGIYSLTGFEVHATGGSEFFVRENFALFAELQPFFLLSPIEYFGVRLNLGANFHF